MPDEAINAHVESPSLIKSELRNRLGEALHKHSYYGEARSWKKPDTDKPKEFIEKYYVSESTKEVWRQMADRFINEMCVDCGLNISLKDK